MSILNRVRARRIDPDGTGAVGLTSYGIGNLHYRQDQFSPAEGASLWEDFPALVALAEPSLFTILEENFLKVTPSANAIPGWTTTTATSGAVTLDATKGLKIDAGATTANQGVNLQLSSNRFTVAAGKPVWFEGRVRFEGLSSLKIQFGFGLAAIQTAIITGGAVGTDDKIAFDGATTAGTIVSDACASATSGTGTGFTIANNTTYKLGFVAQTNRVDFWVNGAVVQSLTSNIPTSALAPFITVKANGTVQPVCYLERLKAAGLL
jgi:hypothetical protein